MLRLQGIECKFLEAWHQKLHTNTTPEDITVCEAYIAFLESGDPATYSRVLWEHGGISREAMANKWDRKIPGDSIAHMQQAYQNLALRLLNASENTPAEQR